MHTCYKIFPFLSRRKRSRSRDKDYDRAKKLTSGSDRATSNKSPEQKVSPEELKISQKSETELKEEAMAAAILAKVCILIYV